jgi:hypothetical protein
MYYKYLINFNKKFDFCFFILCRIPKEPVLYIYIYTLFVACLYKILFNEINMEDLKVLGVETQQVVVNWINANYNNNNDTDPVLIVIEWNINTNLIQRTQIINRMFKNIVLHFLLYCQTLFFFLNQISK